MNIPKIMFDMRIVEEFLLYKYEIEYPFIAYTTCCYINYQSLFSAYSFFSVFVVVIVVIVTYVVVSPILVLLFIVLVFGIWISIILY